MTLLTGHTSPDTAYLVGDYPYGFRLRCQIRYWIETTKHGQRLVSQTTNPKRGNIWNKPKASTYSNLMVLFINDDTGHVEHDALSFYGDVEKIARFETLYAAALTSERDQKELRYLKLLKAREAHMTFTITSSVSTPLLAEESCAPGCASRVPFGECTCGRVDRQNGDAQ